MTKAQQIVKDALTLPVEVRSNIIDQLFESLHGPVDPDVAKAWDQEIAKRVALDKRDKLKYVSGKAAIADLRRHLKK